MEKILLCIVVGLLFGCEKSPEQKYKEQKKVVEQKTQQVIRESLKDPDSAKFRNIYEVCGEVNAKNSYGAYTGFKKFVINMQDKQIYMEPSSLHDENYDNFHNSWRTYCKSGEKDE